MERNTTSLFLDITTIGLEGFLSKYGCLEGLYMACKDFGRIVTVMERWFVISNNRLTGAISDSKL